MDSTLAKSKRNAASNKPHSFVFRFHAKDSAKLATLSDSLNRAISDIYSFFPQIPSNLMVHNGSVDFLRYPLADEPDFDTIIFDEIDMEVFATDTYLCTEKLKGSQLLERGKNENLFSLLYKEQFVVRFEATIKKDAKPEELESFKSIVHNILQNADIEGVSFLSVSFDQEADVLPFSPVDLIPKKTHGVYAYQPLKVPFTRENISLTLHDRDWTNKKKDLSYSCLERDMITRMDGNFVNFSCFDEDDIEIETSKITTQGVTVRINTTYICGIEDLEKPALITDANNNPVWVISLTDDQDDEKDKQNLLLSRVVALPSKNDVLTTFKTQSSYPLMPMFGDMFGADINYLLLSIKSSVVASWIEYGMECVRNVLNDGAIEYEVYLADEMGSQSACFVGDFERMGEFLDRVNSETVLEDQDAPFDIAEDMGCSPNNIDLHQEQLMD